MKTVLFLALALTSLVPAEAVQEPLDEMDLKIATTLGRNSSENTDLSWITDEVRPIVVERLLKDKNLSENDRKFGGYSDPALVSMGHLDTIERLVKEMNSIGYGDNPLEQEGTEVALPYLFPMIYTASEEMPKRKPSDDVIFPSVRTRFAACALEIIYQRNVFSPATREWAGRMLGNLEAPWLREERMNLLKQWWSHNQAAINQKRYGDATWLPALYKGKPSYLNDEEVKELDLAPKPRRAPGPSTISAPTAKPAIPPASSAVVWITIASIVLLLAALGWKSRRNTT